MWMKSQPRCAWKKPLNWAQTPSPWPTCGLWGSPSWSEKAWCLRWSATQEIIGPSIAAEPRAPITARTAGPVLKLRWVKSRWKPTVIPSPVGM